MFEFLYIKFDLTVSGKDCCVASSGSVFMNVVSTYHTSF